VSTSSKSFDLRELVGDLVTLVKDRASDVGQARGSAQPTSEQIELAILAVLADGSKNASEIVLALSLTAAGAWAPTTGKIHPALAKLTEERKASAKTEGDRKIYTITKAGKSAIKDGAAQPAPESGAARSAGASRNLMSCDASFLKSASKLGPVMLDVAQTGTREQQQAAAAVLDEMRNKLHVILAEK
jgi:DNA-binding PadR family transcriptional regulator